MARPSWWPDGPKRRTDRAALTAIRPQHRSTRIEVPGDDPPWRVLLFGSGPASGWGVRDQQHGLAGAVATALHGIYGAAVVLDALVDDHWEERDAAAALRAQPLSSCDALVAVSAYRPELLELSLSAWRRHVEQLRDGLLAGLGDAGRLVVLELPWAEAAEVVPEYWGGAFGRRVQQLSEVAVGTVLDHPRVDVLRAAPPKRPDEWIGPAFSAETYRAWGLACARVISAGGRRARIEPLQEGSRES